MSALHLYLRGLGHNAKQWAQELYETYCHNPLRHTENLPFEGERVRNALYALSEIITLTPRTVRVWDPDKYRGEYIPAIDARTIKDICKQYGLEI